MIAQPETWRGVSSPPSSGIKSLHVNKSVPHFALAARCFLNGRSSARTMFGLGFKHNGKGYKWQSQIYDTSGRQEILKRTGKEARTTNVAVEIIRLSLCSVLKYVFIENNSRETVKMELPQRNRTLNLYLGTQRPIWWPTNRPNVGRSTLEVRSSRFGLKTIDRQIFDIQVPIIKT